MLENYISIETFMKTLKGYIKKMDYLCKIASIKTSGNVIFPNIGEIYYNKLMELIRLYKKENIEENSMLVKVVVISYFNDLLKEGYSQLTSYIKTISDEENLDPDDVWEFNEKLKNYRYRYDVIKNKIAKFDFNTDIDIALKEGIIQFTSEGFRTTPEAINRFIDIINKEIKALGLKNIVPNYGILMMPKYDIDSIANQRLAEMKLLFHDLSAISNAMELTVNDYWHEGQIAYNNKDFETYEHYVEKLLYFNQEYELCNSVGVYICFIGKTLKNVYPIVAREVNEEMRYLNYLEHSAIINEGLRNEKYELQAEKRCTYTSAEVEIDETPQVQKNVYLN